MHLEQRGRWRELWEMGRQGLEIKDGLAGCCQEFRMYSLLFGGGALPSSWGSSQARD